MVPALNEAQSLPVVLGELASEVPELPVLVVSDGSTDETASIARRSGATVLELPVNLGIGGAMRAGFRYAIESGYNAVLQVDADGQHRPSEIPLLLAAATDHDLVIGARFSSDGSYGVRGPRRWTMAILSALLSKVVGTKLTDTTSGFKLVGPRALATFAQDYPSEYLGDTVEALVIAHQAGLMVCEVPVTMRERLAGEPSHGPLRSAVFLARALLAMLVTLSRPAVRAR